MDFNIEQFKILKYQETERSIFVHFFILFHQSLPVAPHPLNFHLILLLLFSNSWMKFVPERELIYVEDTGLISYYWTNQILVTKGDGHYSAFMIQPLVIKRRKISPNGLMNF